MPRRSPSALGRTLLAGVLLAWSGLAGALEPTETDARVIMEAVEARDSGDRQTASLHITIKDAADRERTRVVRSQTMAFDGGRKQLLLFESPKDVRNAGLLSVDYDDASKVDDQWLYLPSLGRTTRIASGDKSGSFMGTDLSYSDMTSKDPNAYDYVMVDADADVDGEACWQIEARPKTDKETSETGYLKTQLWVSKDKGMTVRIKAWVIQGKRLKYTQFSDIRQVDGVWIPHTVTVRTLRDGKRQSESVLRFTDLKLNQESVTTADFTEQRLERGL